MIILEKSEQFLSNIAGLSPSPTVSISRLTIPRIVLQAFIISSLALCCALQGPILWKHYNSSLEALLMPVHLLLTYSSVLVIYISLVLKTNRLFELIAYLRGVIDQRSQLSSDAKNIYQRRNASIEKYVRIGWTWNLFWAIVVQQLTPTLFLLSYAFFGVPSPAMWFTSHSIQGALPFQPDNPYGFAVAILIDLCILCAGTISILSFITIYAGVCLNIKSCIEDIAMSSSQANEKILRHQSIRNDLKQLIIFHIHYYKIMEMLEVIIRAPIFFQISIFCMQLAVILFTLENNITDMSLNTTFILSSLSFFVLNNYMLCYLITTLTIDAMSVGDRIYELNWFQLSRREQFIVYIIIRRSQDAFELKGLGVFVCSLETYAKLVQKALSFYMVFRKLHQ